MVSAPYTDDYKPVNERGSFQPDEWVVKGFNNSGEDKIVRPWVVCADVAHSGGPAPQGGSPAQ